MGPTSFTAVYFSRTTVPAVFPRDYGGLPVSPQALSASFQGVAHRLVLVSANNFRADSTLAHQSARPVSIFLSETYPAAGSTAFPILSSLRSRPPIRAA